MRSYDLRKYIFKFDGFPMLEQQLIFFLKQCFINFIVSNIALTTMYLLNTKTWNAGKAVRQYFITRLWN